MKQFNTLNKITLPILQLGTRLFPYFLSFYLFIVMIQGITWGGLIYKHTGISPDLVLLLVVITGLITLYAFSSKQSQPTTEYNVLMGVSELVIPVLGLLYLFCILVFPFATQLALTELHFHWSRLTDAIGGSFLLLILFTIINKSHFKPRFLYLSTHGSSLKLTLLKRRSIVVKKVRIKLVAFIILSLYLLTSIGRFDFPTLVISGFSSLIFIVFFEAFVENNE